MLIRRFGHIPNSAARPDEFRQPRLVLRFTVCPPDRSQRRAARRVVVVLHSVWECDDAHRLGQSRDQHRKREPDDAT